MRKFSILLITTLLLSIVLIGGCRVTDSDKLKVMTSTTLMTYIVEKVGGSYVEAINLVPPNQHPGNFDVKPEDIQKLSTARLFLLHGWPGETYVDKLVASADNSNLTVTKIIIDANWMLPSSQSTAAGEVAQVLSETDPDHAAVYQDNADRYKQATQAKETEIKNKLANANVSRIHVIASFRQADFLTWAGFNVVATFTSPSSLTPQVLKELVDKGKAGSVTLVINNLQDGEDTGKAIAEELGIKNLNLSSFPGGFSNTETWEKAIDYNVTLLLNAIK